MNNISINKEELQQQIERYNYGIKVSNFEGVIKYTQGLQELIEDFYDDLRKQAKSMKKSLKKQLTD